MELLELVDWWVPHVLQWNSPGVPDTLTQLRAARERDGRIFHVSVYDNGVPIAEAPWKRTRFQSLDVWRTNGTLDGTLSWYSVDSYGRRDPRTTQHWVPNCTSCFPSGFGVELWPPPPGHRDKEVWTPIETIVRTMLGAGLQDAEYLYALSKHQTLLGPTAKSLLDYARTLASGFPSGCFPLNKDWGDAGYAVDREVHANGSGAVNTWKLAMGRALDDAVAAEVGLRISFPETRIVTQLDVNEVGPV